MGAFSCKSLARATRLVRSTATMFFSGSIQMLVPVKPKCPRTLGEKRDPAAPWPLGSAPSHPSVRLQVET